MAKWCQIRIEVKCKAQGRCGGTTLGNEHMEGVGEEQSDWDGGRNVCTLPWGQGQGQRQERELLLENGELNVSHKPLVISCTILTLCFHITLFVKWDCFKYFFQRAIGCISV